MTLVETCLLIVAIAASLVSVAAVIALTRLLSLWGTATLLLREMREVIGRLNTIAAEWEQTTFETRKVRRRITATANRLLDDVEPPIREFSAILSGIRVGLGALFAGSRNGARREEGTGYDREAASDREPQSEVSLERKQP